MKNAGKYKHKISIIQLSVAEDGEGFVQETRTTILSPYASIKTTKGFTLVLNGTDFEKAFTNFTIRYPKTSINRDMLVQYGSKTYTIEYLNNIDEKNEELELQCKEVMK